MKPIQVLLDERLLARLDADDEVKALGRSEVLRRAVADYLRRRRVLQTAEAYRRAYGDGSGVDDELRGWTNEAAWPE